MADEGFMATWNTYAEESRGIRRAIHPVATRTMPSRAASGEDKVGFNRDMSSPELNYTLMLDRKLATCKQSPHVHFFHMKPPFHSFGDFRIVFGQDGIGFEADLSEEEKGLFRRAVDIGVPVLGVLHLTLILDSKPAGHVVAYMIRLSPPKPEIVFLESYDVFKNYSAVGFNWHYEVAKRIFASIGISDPEGTHIDSPEAYDVSAPIFDTDISLQKKDAGKGQCLHWASEILEAIACSPKIRELSAIEMTDIICKLTPKGGVRRTRRAGKSSRHRRKRRYMRR